MRVWLASFPRSGNTFLRNLLFDIHGLESSTYHHHEDHIKDENWQDFPIIKTHLLPQDIPELSPQDKVIYLVRDGRDSMCSIAHHRKDIVAPGTDFLENMEAAIYAEKGSFFGGWDKNALSWLDRCGILIRYEDLVRFPEQQLRRIEAYLELEKGDYTKARSFKEMKYGQPKYGAGIGHGYEEEKAKELAEKNFRKGKIGSWKEEMPEEFKHLFWSFYCETLQHFGYTRNGDSVDQFHPDLDWLVLQKLGKEPRQNKEKIKVLIETEKLTDASNDGIKRYTLELVKGLSAIAENPSSDFHFDLLVNRRIIPINQWESCLGQAGQSPHKATTKKREIKLPYPVKVARNLFWEAFGLLPKFIRETYNNLFNKAVVWRRNRLIEKAFQSIIPELESYDLIHLTLPQHYFYFKNVKGNFVTTVHDLSHRHFPDFHEQGNIDNAEKGIRFIQDRNSAVIAVSKFTAEDVANHVKINQDQIFAIPEGVDRSHFRKQPNQQLAAEIYEKYDLPANEPYILSLSTLEPRKNLVNTIKAFNRLLRELPHLKVNLVIAGKKGWKFEEILLLQQVEPHRVYFTDYISEEDLPVLYTNALALIYVSHFEGFGLPILEAMNCGTPVVYGFNSSQTEVADRSGYPVVNTKDYHAIKHQMESAITLHSLRAEKTNLSLEKAGDYSWRASVIDTVECYRKLLN